MSAIETRLLTVASVVLGVSLLVLVGLIVRRELLVQPNPGQADLVRADWQQLLSHPTAIGDSTAKHIVVVFSDYQCPACRDYDQVLDSLVSAHPSEVRIIFRNYPLRTIHPDAEVAANAAECAAEVGAFRRFHQLLFAEQDSLKAARWGRWSAQAGIRDTARFVQCVRERRLSARITNDLALAEHLRLHRTPSVLFDGALYGSKPDYQKLEAGLRSPLTANRSQ
jgi:protein-disulfide isomerase